MLMSTMINYVTIGISVAAIFISSVSIVISLAFRKRK